MADRPMEPLTGGERVLLESLLRKTAKESDALAVPREGEPEYMVNVRRNIGQLADIYREIARKVAVR